MNEETQRWKNKYLNKLDETDALKISFEEKIAILERLLVRVSLAAEGLDKKLDDELASLRVIIRREDTNSTDLNEQLDSIEKHVLAMDQNREESAEGVLRPLSQMADQLLNYELSREQKKSLKRFRKKLSGAVNDARQHPGLLTEVCDLQRDILNTLSQGEDKEKPGGLLGRFFKSRSDESHLDMAGDNQGIEAAVKSKPTASSTSINLQESAAQLSGSGLLSRPGQTEVYPERDNESSSMSQNGPEPGFSAVAEHVCSTLDNLVEKLRFPESMDKDALKVREKVTLGLNWYELVPALDDVANLVIAAFGNGQKEFESFLKSLDARLISIQSFLEMNRSSHDMAAKNKAELQQEMQAHFTSIQQDVRENSDFNALKTTVQSDLDAMLVSLERYMRKESNREEEMVAEMAELQARLQAMESDSMEMQQQLVDQQQKAMTDGLTGLPNRVAYENRVQLEFERWRRYRSPLTLVVADIDRFKLVNDRYGHLSGDKVIQLIGKEVSNRIRKTDFMARYGGEEFVILLPETKAEVAFSVMDKTREMISRMPFHFQNQKVQVTLSMGLCEFCEDAEIQQIFEQADQALYKAKSAGRNQIQVAESSKW